MVLRGLGLRIQKLKTFRITNAEIADEETLLVELPERFTSAIIFTIANAQKKNRGQ